MKNAKEFMNEFITTLYNMKKYQGIDIIKPETYGGEHGIVHKAFDFEKKIAATIEAENINENCNKLGDLPKQLRLTTKK